MDAPGSASRTKLWMLAPLLVAAVTIAALLPSTNVRWSADDSYVLEHLQARDWGTRLFAFNLDRPSDAAGAWWDGIVYQRRFVRIVPSAFMALEVRVLGQDPWRVHVVSLALHLFNALLIFHLSRRRLQDAWKAALVAMVFGAHPVVLEVGSWFACQPLLLATACLLLATEAWIRYRLTTKGSWLAAATVSMLAAVLSYEAAIAGPVLLVLGDIALRRRVLAPRRAWPPRLAVLGVLVPFLFLSLWNNAGVVAPETSYRPGFAEVWTVARIDLEAYLLKGLGLVQPGAPAAYWIHNRVGEAAVVALLLAVIVPLGWWARRDPLALLGILTFAAFLAPPWLMRATFSALNQPSLRQLYLPLLGLAATLTSALCLARLRTALILTLPVIAAFIFFDRQPRGGPGSGAADSARFVVAQALASDGVDVPVIISGSFEPVLDRAGCAYDLSLTWPGRPQLNLIPPSRSGAAPRLVRTSDHSFTAHADAEGFAIALRRRPPPNLAVFSSGGVRITPTPPQLMRDGHQQVGGARIELVGSGSAVIHTLRYTLDKPIEQYAFLAVEGCTKARANRPQ